MNQRREEELFAKIEEGFKGDLGDYRKAIQRMVEESGHDTLEIAASLAFLEAGKKGLRYEDMPTPPRKQRRDRDDKPDRSFRNNERGDHRIGVIGKTDDLPKTTTCEAIGWKSVNTMEYKKGDIVGAIANEVGLDPRNMGKNSHVQGSHLH